MGENVSLIDGHIDSEPRDMVEVVRCKNCIYRDDCPQQITHTTRDYVLEQNVSTYNKVDFCSYGERRGKQECEDI